MSVAALWAFGGLPGRLAAQPAQRMSFRNNIQPGHLTIHRIDRTIVRTAARGKVQEQLEYRQQGEWVQCNIDKPKPASVMVYQMMVDGAAEVVGVHRGKKKVAPTPPARDFNLPRGSTRLVSGYKSLQDAPAQVPLTEPAQKAILCALLDFAHWPKQRVTAGHRWQRDLRGNGLAGTQTFEFVDMAKAGEDVVARVTLYVEGRFEDPLDRDYVFGKAQAIIYWSRSDCALVKIEAQADYQRRRGNTPEQFKLKLSVARTRLAQLAEQEQEDVTNQMVAFDSGLQEYRRGRLRETHELCAEFRRKWPRSLWMPAVDELDKSTMPQADSRRRLSRRQLSEFLAKAIITVEAAKASHEYDVLERTLRGLEELADSHHGALTKLARSDDAGQRARAVFALAFSKRPEDLREVERAVKDDDGSVRAMALAALAVRRDTGTAAELLVAALDDENAGVRRRACQAVAVCLAREHYLVGKAIEKLDHLMVYDETDGVRLEAVRAIATLGNTADIPKLEKTLTHELNQEIRREIERAIRKLAMEEE